MLMKPRHYLFNNLTYSVHMIKQFNNLHSILQFQQKRRQNSLSQSSTRNLPDHLFSLQSHLNITDRTLEVPHLALFILTNLRTHGQTFQNLVLLVLENLFHQLPTENLHPMIIALDLMFSLQQGMMYY